MYLFIIREKCLTIQKYKNSIKSNKLKIIAPTWNDEFELSDDF